MKFSLIIFAFLATLAVVNCHEVAPRDLNDDFEDLLRVIDVPAVKRTLLKYYSSDKETKQFVRYLKGETFGAVWNQVFTNDQVLNFLRYVRDGGVDVEGVINQVANFLKHPKVNLDDIAIRSNAKGLKELVKEVIGHVHLEELLTLFAEKLETSPELKEFYDTVSGFDYQAIQDFVAKSAEIQDLYETIKSYDVDIDGFILAVEEFFGWH
ncbi:hypothetical protein DMENIID0001_066660 [Sergentomyia squamirostris]